MSPTSLVDTAWHPLADGSPPPWASGWGEDRRGVFVEFAIGVVRQRLRWIPPGRFWMGSPEDEPGRFEGEGPRHEVTIEKGYWLFDTPCTQALWQAVMGDNPSYFKTPDRPVEQVSWDDVQIFLKRINDDLPGLNLVLPSEAQWEYACRAGTTTALYTGDIKILGKHNAPALDLIAWYGGNSGVGFELDDGYDNTGWEEKQYPHTQAGTHPVGRKAPNPWGLYDMLGNVLEWCNDHWHESYEGAPTDGSSWQDDEAGGDRVIRGGSWIGFARYVRAAYRSRHPSDGRFDGLGFRCARVHP
ncbi:MAG: formylglycine-generating enzyme family protein [Magnetococcales bacterium]|nr:formylglycine-generating enzyme family protein [Magnetococcales bacterium]